jgi:endonuclease/exonuclease/phosphatase (EEP) superfamily protein YafD
MASPNAAQIARLTNEETDMVADTDVLGHIQRQNDERNARAAAEGWEWWTSLAESLADEYSNVYQLEHSMAVSTYSDIHKEIYCVRPNLREEGIFDMTLSELGEAIEELTGQEGVYTT